MLRTSQILTYPTRKNTFENFSCGSPDEKERSRKEFKMTKREIFEDIVQIMKEDSASCKDKTGEAPDRYLEKITEDMEDMEFLYLVNSYLNTFELTGHLAFSKKGVGGVGFGVQRYENVLYVTSTSKDVALKTGDKIIRVDGLEICDYEEKHKSFLFGETQERQAPHWMYLLKYAKNITYVSGEDGKEYCCDMKTGFFESQEEKYVCRDLGNGIVFIRFADFEEEEKIQRMYDENAELLKNSRVLIVDVRGNGGGSDTCFLPLLQYALPNGKKMDEIELVDESANSGGSEINYSVRNCDTRLKGFEQYLQMELPEETRAILLGMRDELLANRGKGFVKNQNGETVIPIVGDSKVEKMYIITDSGCASSGDNFVAVFQMFSKVTVFGRPTMGILDYSNVAFAEYGDFYLMYPTSRLLSVDKGNGMMKKGVKVDHYIPWTPEHLRRDVDLETVLEEYATC